MSGPTPHRPTMAPRTCEICEVSLIFPQLLNCLCEFFYESIKVF